MLEKYNYGIHVCGRCGKCITGKNGYVCPVWVEMGRFEEYCAKGRNSIAREILDGNLNYTPELVDSAYTCLGCNSCFIQCGKTNHDTHELCINETKIMQAMRADIVRAGMEPESLQAVDASVDETHNPFGEATAKRADWAKDLNLPAKGETVYFAGCYAAYRNPKIAKATVAILQNGGIDVAYLGEDEWCCGVPQFADGNVELAEKMILHNVEALKAAGVKRVVTSCAGCFHALNTEYPEIVGELPFEVVHSSEVIADLVETGKIKLDKKIEKTITYHDPCHLGRHENVYDAPRAVLSAIPGAELVEMPRNRDTAWCCGGGSIVSTVFPDLTKDIASGRVAEAKATNADILVSACPSCENNLTPGARREKMPVYDLSVIVAEAMGLDLNKPAKKEAVTV